MNPKIFVGVAAVALVAVLVGILMMSSSFVGTPGGTINDASSQQQPQVLPLIIYINEIETAKISDRGATINVSFNLTNPNERSVIVQTLNYQLFETNYSESEPVSGGQIGSRPGGMVEFGSNYFTLLAGHSITLKDTIALKNPGSLPDLWVTLEDDTASWRVVGDVFYNLSSMTSGQENELHFDLSYLPN